ncbi:MAG: peroxiredoxin family protein [Candidatus Polarisedimenticolia bacterium]
MSPRPAPGPSRPFRRDRLAALALLAVLAAPASLPAQKLPKPQPTPGHRVGDLAHDFTLQDLQGRTIRLRDLRGRKVVHLVFWASWCVPCMQEIPVLRAHYDRYRARGLEILGVVLQMNQTPDIVRVISRQFEVNYPVLFDADDVARKKYRVEAIPQNFLIDRDGIIRHAGTVLPRDYDALLEKLLQGETKPASD